MCLQGADGRPAVLPLLVRRVGWSDDARDAERAVTRGEARQFSVLAWDGRRAGLFSAAGATEVAGVEARVALGSYAGAAPCAAARSAARPSPGDDPDCAAVQGPCGVALAELDVVGAGHPYDEDPDPAAFAIGGACAAAGKLLVDVDGDGAAEAFPLDQFLDAMRAPAEEVTAVAAGDARCRPAFAVRGALPAGDPRDWRGLDVLAVVDADRDGRHELVLSYRYGDRRTWAVYGAPSSPRRLELLGEAVPVPRAPGG
jgi:hypothetical protein